MAGRQEAFQSKTGQFSPSTKESDPVIAAFSSEINICYHVGMHGKWSGLSWNRTSIISYHD
jgi:hypothetical protein